MLYSNFKNYEEFKELFGIVEHGNGVKSRKNKILLAYIKDKNVRKFLRGTEWYKNVFMDVKSMASLNIVVSNLMDTTPIETARKCVMRLRSWDFWSDKYRTDHMDGICEDGSTKFIRYINTENGRVFKMKAGKMMRHLIECSEFGRILPEQVKVWFAEDFAREWEAYAMDKCPQYTLHVDDDFRRIYDSDECEGDFGSCMTDRDYHYFYENAVEARAAYLTNSDDKIIARCVIFDEVKDVVTGEVFRYAERQYSTNGNIVLQQALVTALINAKEIDCYKKVGAGCGDSRAIVGVNGEDFSDRKLQIKCNLDFGDTLSYQDTFKNYNMDRGIADNYYYGDYSLDTTDGELYGAWDDFHEEYCQETTQVYYNGQEYYCDIDRLDDFRQVDGYYIHEDDIYYCPNCGETLVCYYYEYERLGLPVVDCGEYSEFEGCYDCVQEAEEEWKKDNGWVWSEVDGYYIDPADDTVVPFYKWSCGCMEYQESTISMHTLNARRCKAEYNGVWFETDGYGCFYDNPSKYVEKVLEEVA